MIKLNINIIITIANINILMITYINHVLIHVLSHMNIYNNAIYHIITINVTINMNIVIKYRNSNNIHR